MPMIQFGFYFYIFIHWARNKIQINPIGHASKLLTTVKITKKFEDSDDEFDEFNQMATCSYKFDQFH
uniref:Uncharacterized protein n=1 Tax=Onchocerca volvulus TaxID=6282 RepID=A0A8R1XP77_ONCVO